MQRLVQRIESRQAAIGVIGLGYVGLPVAATLARAGFRVTGVDVKAARVATIDAGGCPVDGNEPGLAELIANVVASKRLVATTDYAVLAGADVVLICVDTPVARDHRARFAELRAACRDLGGVLGAGTLVVVESTVAPGTCASVVAPILENCGGKTLNRDFFLGHCPERVMPGKLLANLHGLARVCGGASPVTCDAMVALYSTIVDARLDKSDLITAELVKTAENAYRDVNIAFANELAVICEATGADFLRVRELVNESPGRSVLLAGAGVGGHCIPKDPWLLVQDVPGVEARLIAAARSVNDAMPLHVARLVEDALDSVGTTLAGSRVAVLGYAYLENTGDVRNSPSEALVAHLGELGARTAIHDPFVPAYATSMWQVVEGADAVVIMVAHGAYRDLDLARLCGMLRRPVLVDGRHVVEPRDAVAAGFTFRAIGRGISR